MKKVGQYCPEEGKISVLNPEATMDFFPPALVAPKVVWLEADDQHKRVINGSKLETLYIRYKSYGNWAVLGTIGDRDVHIKTCANEADAQEWLEMLLKKLS